MPETITLSKRQRFSDGTFIQFGAYAPFGFLAWQIFSAANGALIAASDTPGGYTVTPINPTPGQALESGIPPYMTIPFIATVEVPEGIEITGHFVLYLGCEISGGWTYAIMDTRYQADLFSADITEEIAVFTWPEVKAPVDVNYYWFYYASGYDGPYNALNGRVETSWDWEFGDGTSLTTTSNPIPHEYDEGTFIVRSRVRDQYGLLIDNPTLPPFGSFTTGGMGWRERTITIEGDNPSSFSDHDGVLYVASTVGNDVQVHEYKDGTPTEIAKYTLVNHKAPSIYQHKNDTRIYLSATDRSDGEYRLYQSPDRAVSFEEVTE